LTHSAGSGQAPLPSTMLGASRAGPRGPERAVVHRSPLRWLAAPFPAFPSYRQDRKRPTALFQPGLAGFRHCRRWPDSTGRNTQLPAPAEPKASCRWRGPPGAPGGAGAARTRHPAGYQTSPPPAAVARAQGLCYSQLLGDLHSARERRTSAGGGAWPGSLATFSISSGTRLWYN
jgi:hypothetical protein